MSFVSPLSGKTLQRYEKNIKKANIAGRNVRESAFLCPSHKKTSTGMLVGMGCRFIVRASVYLLHRWIAKILHIVFAPYLLANDHNDKPYRQ